MDNQQYENLALVVQKHKHVAIGQYSTYTKEMGLIDTYKLDDEAYLKLGIAIRAGQRKAAWYWIDFLIGAKKRWGENFPQILSLYGEFNPHTIMDSINLGSWDFPLEERKWKLSPSHYRLVRSLPKEAQTLLLGLAEKNNWGSSITLRAEVKKIREAAENTPQDSEDLNADSEDTPTPATTLAEAFQTPHSVQFSTQGDKTQIANVLAGVASRFEKSEWGYYAVTIEITKIADMVLDNTPPTDVS